MRSITKLLLQQSSLVALSAVLPLTAYAAAFGSGNLAVLRVGSGASALTNACTEVFVDEYTTAGVLVQSIALPTAVKGENQPFCLSGTATSEGMMSLSADGMRLTVPGYAAVPGTAGIATAAGVNRVVASISAEGIVDTSTAFNDGYLLNNVRGATTTDGFSYWLSGTGNTASGGVRVIDAGTTSSTQVSTTVTNTRAVAIFDDQLYVSASSGAFRLASVGVGVPNTAGQTITNLPGFSTAAGSPYQFYFADLDAGVPGLDTLWVANDNATGLQKHALVSGNWVALNAVGVAADGYRGLTRVGEELYFTGRAGGVGVIRSIAGGGYNTNLVGSANTIATAGANQVYQGIAPAPLGLPTVLIANVSQNEGNSGTSTMTFTATLSRVSASNCNFALEAYASGTDTATPGVDFVALTSPQLVIPAGQTSVTFAVTINGDTTVEADETFSVDAFGEPSTCSLSGSEATGTILNDEGQALATVAIDDVSITEGNAGTSNAVLTLTRNNATTAFSVNYATADGTALSTSDYQSSSGTLSFTVGGELTQTISIPVNGDTSVEPNENFVVNLTNLVDGTGVTTLSDAQGQVTITNDDSEITINLAAASLTEGDSGTANMDFPVSLSANAPSNASVPFTVTAGSASAPADYTTLSGTVNLVSGSSTAIASVTVVGDLLDENNETLTVTLGAPPAGYVVGTGGALGTIIDNDAPPTLSLNAPSVVEGDVGSTPMNFIATLSAASSFDISFSRATSNGTAQAGSDYTALAAATLTIPAGQTSITVPVNILGDTAVEGNENFSLALTAITNSSTSSTSNLGTITDNDSSITISVNDLSVTEGNSGNSNANFTVNLSAPAPTGGTLIDFSTADGTALAGSDYVARTAQTLTIPAGTNTGTITVQVIGDSTVEPDERFVVNLSNPRTGNLLRAVNYSISDGQGEAVIVNDDAVIVLSIAAASVTEGNNGTVNLNLPVTLSAPAPSATNVPFTVVAGTASNPADYITASGNVTITAGSTSAVATVAVVGDLLDEANETLVVTLGAPPAGYSLGTASATGTITDDDAAPSISLNAPGANEGSPLQFVVTLSAPSSFDISFQRATADGSATAGVDYTALSAALVTIPAGQTSASIAVSTLTDGVNEPDETVVLNLTQISNAALTSLSASGTIRNVGALVAVPSLNWQGILLLCVLVLTLAHATKRD